MKKDEILDQIASAFECQRCGNCCTKTKHIKLTQRDIARMIAGYGLHRDSFVTHNTPHGNKFLAGDFIKHDHPCQFYDASIPGCKIYDARPTVCRKFPIEEQRGEGTCIKVYDECPAMQAALTSLGYSKVEVPKASLGQMKAHSDDN